MCHRNASQQGPFITTTESHVNSASSAARLRYWEIEPYFKCPVVGMCLTQDEQKRVLKKSGINTKKATPFMIHELCVAGADEESPLSRKLDALLNRKFSSQIQGLTHLDERTLLDEWQRAFRTGGFAGAFWAMVTRRDLSPETRRHIFGAVHMSMHENAGEMGKLRRRITMEKGKAEELQKKARELASEAGSLKQENRRLDSVCEMLKRRISTLEKEKDGFETECLKLKNRRGVDELETSISKLETEKREITIKYKKLQNNFTELEKKNQALAQNLEKEMDELEEFRAETRRVMEEMAQMNRCDQACPSFDLCQKRILIVGGMSRMEDLYRRFIENSGGVFDYHDGYVKRGVRTLEERLKRADIVLCPVSCNSHAACSVIKNMGKKHKKPVHFLFNSSLNALSQALSQKGEDHGIRH
jgi:hypothetical protein